MSINIQKKTNEERKAHKIGVALTIGAHLLLIFVLTSTCFKSVYPPPKEMGILVDYQANQPKPIMVKSGNEPRVEKPNPKKEIRLVQKSESSIKGKGSNKGSESTMGDKGDIAKYEAPRPKPINKKALFPSSNNGDSSSAQISKNISKALTAGHSEGNTKIGREDGEPSARLAGRSMMGNLPEPDYSVNKSGKVVVKIMVDQFGAVVNAIPGAGGTTVQDKILWESARKAALKAKFNISSNAPVVQEGTITYIFKLQ